MCSNRCANPVRPGSSLAGPTWYQMLVATIGSRWSSDRITSRPFGKVYFSKAIFGMSGVAGAAGGALFVVWQQGREDTAPQGDFRFGRDIGGAFNTPGSNVFLVKMSRWLNF